MKLLIKIIWCCIFSLCCIILLINLIGLRYNPYAVRDCKKYAREDDTTISYECVLNNLKYLKYVRDHNIYEQKNIIKNIVDIVFNRMSNLLEKQYCGKNLYGISIFDDWILWVKTNFIDKNCIYEFADPYRALKTGAGRCSQQSMVVAELLRELDTKPALLI